jgi:hypothetical protein
MMGTLGNAAKVGAGTATEEVSKGANLKAAGTKGGAAAVNAAMMGEQPAAAAPAAEAPPAAEGADAAPPAGSVEE